MRIVIRTDFQDTQRVICHSTLGTVYYNVRDPQGD